MKKFNINDYTWNDVDTVLDLVPSPESNITYRFRISNVEDKLTLTDLYKNPCNMSNDLYVKRVHELYSGTKCVACNSVKPIFNSFNNRLLCERHYNNETTLAKMSIRDFLFKIDNQKDYDLFKENYNSYIHNEHDLKFPCLIVLHREYDNQYDEEIFTSYIINENMNEVK